MRRRVGLLVAGTALLAAATACSASGKSSNSSAASVPRAPVAAAGQAGAGAMAQDQAKPPAQGGAQAPVGLPLKADSDRAIIYNGTMTVAVSNVDNAVATLEGLATGAGGYVGGEQRSVDGSRASATVTVRVPVDQFYSIINAIGRQGDERDRQISAEDVTAKLVDVQARLKTQQASVDRIRALMSQTRSITDVTTLESELSRREADLESLEAQQRDLTNLTTLSTITVTLVSKDAPVAKPKKPETGFLAGLKSGWHAFTSSLKAVLTALGAVLPFAIAIGVPVWLVLYVLRRRRRPAPSESG